MNKKTLHISVFIFILALLFFVIPILIFGPPQTPKVDHPNLIFAPGYSVYIKENSSSVRIQDSLSIETIGNHQYLTGQSKRNDFFFIHYPDCKCSNDTVSSK